MNMTTLFAINLYIFLLITSCIHVKVSPLQFIRYDIYYCSYLNHNV